MPSSGPGKRPKNLRKFQCGLQWLCVTPARHVDWLASLLAATFSQYCDRGLSNSQSDFISMLCRRLCLRSLCNRHFFEVRNISGSQSLLRATRAPDAAFAAVQVVGEGIGATGSALRGHSVTSNTVSRLKHACQQPGQGPDSRRVAAACAYPLPMRSSNSCVPARAHFSSSVPCRLLRFRAVCLHPGPILTGGSCAGSATISSLSEDVLSLSGAPTVDTRSQLTPSSSQKGDGAESSTPAGAIGFPSSIVT